MPAQAVPCRLRLRTAGPLEGDSTMDAKNFTLLVQGIKEMAAHMRGEDVPGLKVTTVPDPDVHAPRETADVAHKELAALRDPMRIEKIAQAIEADAGEALPDLRHALAEAQMQTSLK